MFHVDGVQYQRVVTHSTLAPFRFTDEIHVSVFMHNNRMPLYDSATFPTNTWAYNTDIEHQTIYNSHTMKLTQFVQMWRAIPWRWNKCTT